MPPRGRVLLVPRGRGGLRDGATDAGCGGGGGDGGVVGGVERGVVLLVLVGRRAAGVRAALGERPPGADGQRRVTGGLPSGPAKGTGSEI